MKTTSTDVGELSKLTALLTKEQTINALSSKGLTDQQLIQILMNKGIAESEAKAIATKIVSSSANGTVTFSLKAYTAALLENIKALGAWMLTNPVGWIIGIVTAIGIAVGVYNKFNVSLEEQKQHLKETNKEYVKLKNEAKNLNQEIENNNQLISELQEKTNNGTISLVEEDELRKLKLQNDLLLQQKKAKDDLAHQKKVELIAENRETFINEFTGSLGNSTDYNFDVGELYGTRVLEYKDTSDRNLILLLEENKKRLKDAINSDDEEMITALQEDKEILAEELNNRSDTILLSLLEYKNNLAEAMNPDGTFTNELDKITWDAIESWEKAIYEHTSNPGEWNTVHIKAAIDNASLNKLQTDLAGRLDFISEKDIESLLEVNVALHNANLILEDGQTPASVFLQYLRDIVQAGKDINSLEQPKVFEFEDVLEQLEESYTSLKSLKEEVDSTKQISVDTIQDIMSKYPKLTDLLADYVQEKADEEDVIAALSEEYETDMNNYKLYMAQKNGEDETFYNNIVDNLSDDLIKKAEYYDLDLKDYKSYNEAKLAMDKEYQIKKNNLENSKSALNNGYKQLQEQGVDPNNPFPYNNLVQIGIYEKYQENKEELEGYEEFLKDFDTGIATAIPEFNTNLLTPSDSTEEFSDSIDWATNSISNLEKVISDLNDEISNTDDIDKKIKLLNQLKTEQEKLVTVTGESRDEYKDKYDKSLYELTPAQKKKYQSLIESDTEFDIQDFKGKEQEKLFKKITNSQSLWQSYQKLDSDNKTAQQDVKDTDKAISDTDVLERSKQAQEQLEKELDTVNEKLNDSTLSTEQRNDLLKQQYGLQKSINDELRIQANHNKDTETVKKLDAEDENDKREYDTNVYDNDKDGVLREVDKNNNAITDIQNAIDLSGKGTEQQYLGIIDLQEKNIKQWEIQRDKALKLRDANKDNLVLYQYWDNELQDCEDNIQKMNSGIKEMHQNILELPLKDVEQKLKSIDKEIDSANTELDEQTELINAAIAYFDEEIEVQNTIKEGIQDKIDALQEEHDLREANLNIQRAEWELQKAKTQKSIKVFKEGVGFVYESDQADVQEKQANLDNLLYERKIQLLNEEVKKVDDNIESLTKQKKQWEDIVPLMERSALYSKAMAYDSNFKNKVLASDVGLLTTISQKYGEIYSKVGSLEESKEPYELLQEELTDISQLHSVGGISYDDALAQTMSALQKYYPELVAKYDEQKTSLEEVAKKQLENVGVTEETSGDTLEEIKTTNDEITLSYDELLTSLTKTVRKLNILMNTFAKKASNTATSVKESMTTISSAISAITDIQDTIDVENSIPENLTPIDPEYTSKFADIVSKLNSEIITNLKPYKETTFHPVTTNKTQTNSFTFGDIVLNEVQNADGLASAIVGTLQSAVTQELYKS